MGIIHVYLTPSEVKRLCLQDRDYLKRKLEDNCLLNSILHRPVNKQLLSELRCILDSEPVPRRKTERHARNSKVNVFNNQGVLIRIEHGTGKVLKQLAQGG